MPHCRTSADRRDKPTGVSTSSVDDLVKALGMSGVFKSQVIRQREEINERVKIFLEQPIERLAPSVDRRDLCEGAAKRPRRLVGDNHRGGCERRRARGSAPHGYRPL